MSSASWRLICSWTPLVFVRNFLKLNPPSRKISLARVYRFNTSSSACPPALMSSMYVEQRSLRIRLSFVSRYFSKWNQILALRRNGLEETLKTTQVKRYAFSSGESLKGSSTQRNLNTSRSDSSIIIIRKAFSRSAVRAI